LRYLGPETATAAELYPETAEWSTRAKTNAILAEIFDVLAQLNENFTALAEKRKAETVERYPRPGQQQKKKENADARHFGSGALPPAELRAFFESKRKEQREARTNAGHD